MVTHEEMDMSLPRGFRSLIATACATSVFWILVLRHWSAGGPQSKTALVPTSQRDILQDIQNATLGVGPLYLQTIDHQ